MPRSRASSTPASSRWAAKSRNSKRISRPTRGVKHRHRREHRHERAAPGAARREHRPGRRSHHRAVHLRGDGGGHLLHAAPRPVFVDIDPRTFTMDPAQIEAAITPRTKAIIPVHLYGQCADMDPILAIAQQAQAHRASRTPARRTAPSTRAGAPAAWATWALSASTRARTWAPTAKAAWSSTNNAEYARTIRMLRDWGAEKKYQHVLKGYNFRLEGIQGAVLRVKLKYLERLDRGAPRRGRTLRRSCCGQRHADARGACRTTGTSITSMPSVRPTRAAWQEALNAAGVQSGIHYPIPVHLLPALRRSRLPGGTVPALGDGRE